MPGFYYQERFKNASRQSATKLDFQTAELTGIPPLDCKIWREYSLKNALFFCMRVAGPKIAHHLLDLPFGMGAKPQSVHKKTSDNDDALLHPPGTVISDPILSGIVLPDRAGRMFRTDNDLQSI